MDEHICPLCGEEMTNCSHPQRPKWICEDCDCDENGIEVDYCEFCGEPFVAGDDKDCDCEDYDDGYYYDDWDDSEDIDICPDCGEEYDENGEPTCDCQFEEYEDEE